MIIESQRPLQEQIPRPAKGIKDGKEGKNDYIENLIKKQKRRRHSKSISTVSSREQNLKKQHQSVETHITSTGTLIGGQFKKSITPSAR